MFFFSSMRRHTSFTRDWRSDVCSSDLCHASSDQGHGFGGRPIFYGHFPKDFNETKDHPGNAYWYQGKIFNEFVQGLDDKQQTQALAKTEPRKERPNTVIAMKKQDFPGLCGADLSKIGRAHV